MSVPKSSGVSILVRSDLSVDSDSRPNQTDKLWDVAQGHAASEAHERKISAGGPEEPQGKTFDQPPFQLKRKIELDSQDDQVVSQPGSSSRKYVYILSILTLILTIPPDTLPFRHKELYVVEKEQVLTLTPFHQHPLTRTKCMLDHY